MFDIYANSRAWASALLLTGAMLLSWGAGLWMGKLTRNRDNVRATSKFDDASLALLGLLLAFTFSTSIQKHDQRRMMVIADANAIGDFYTCATLLNEPVRSNLQRVIRDYTALRLKTAQKSSPGSDFEAVLTRFQTMHSQMTDLVSQAISDHTPIAVSLTNTLNAVTSDHASRLAAIRDRLPPDILLLLFAAAILSTMLIGREQGASGKIDTIGTPCFILLIALAIYVTLELNQPESGFIRVSQEPMERVLSSMLK
jgi:hypothetical protein